MKRIRHLNGCGLLALLLLTPGVASAYNILALDMGAYWNDLSNRFSGAVAGYGTPGAAGERWYTMVNYNNLATTNLMDYDVLLVQSGFTDDWLLAGPSPALGALQAKSSDILSFVQAGHGLVAWAQPFPDGSSHLWDWAPVTVQSRGVYHQEPVDILDPTHPVMQHSTNASLSNWTTSWHGYFDAWDSRLSPVSQTGDIGQADPASFRALTLAGHYNPGGCGRMVFSMQDPDYHAYQGFDGAQVLYRDALDWAAICHPVPEPSTGLMVLGGLLAVGLFRILPRGKSR